MTRAARGLGRLVRWSVWTVSYPCRRVLRLLGIGAPARLARQAPLAAAELAADEGLTKLAEALSDPDPAARILALDVICEFSEERAARLIASMLYDPEPRVRCAAAQAAVRARASGTVFSLITALGDPDPKVVDAAAAAIEAITGKKVQLEDDVDARREGLERLTQWWKQQRVSELEHELEL